MQHNFFEKMPDNRTGYKTRDDYAFFSRKVFLTQPRENDTAEVYDNKQPTYSLLNQYSQDLTRLYETDTKNALLGSFQGRAVLAFIGLDELDIFLFECPVEKLKESFLAGDLDKTIERARKQRVVRI